MYYYKFPLGILELTASETSITSLTYVDIEGKYTKKNNILEKLIYQLDEYFLGKRKEFNLNYEIQGTEFQNKVWNSLKKITYGETCSYKDIAIDIKNENASRAVGNANNKNPLSIIIPCHRVIGANKSLTGYAGGLHIKEWLLNHEKKFS
ncbi:MAG: methylated-DNA--[protein]-cysteine S-methyltransferase [Fusobacteriaceae bacterium]